MSLSYRQDLLLIVAIGSINGCVQWEVAVVNGQRHRADCFLRGEAGIEIQSFPAILLRNWELLVRGLVDSEAHDVRPFNSPVGVRWRGLSQLLSV